MWTQNLDPFGHQGISAFVAALPIAFLFWALAIQRLKGHWAALGALGLALCIAVAAFRMPATLAVAALVHGAAFGLFPIGWIVFSAVFLHTIMERTGQFAALQTSIASLTTDRRIQAILVAFCFGALVEACAGFGAPVAISAGILAGLGFPLIEAAELCLIANTAPVAFGSIGIPILVAGQVSGIDPVSISQMVGRQLPILSLIVPLYVVAIMAGLKGVRETWPTALIAGASFAVTQWWASNYLGTDAAGYFVRAGVDGGGRELAVVAAAGTPGGETQDHRQNGRGTFMFAWAPFLIVSVVMIVWALPSVKALLDITTAKLPVPFLHNAVESGMTHKPIAAEYTINWLSASGTALFLASLVTAFTQGLAVRTLSGIFAATLKKLQFPLLTMASLLGYAYLGNASGMTVTLGLFVANAGFLFPLFSPLLGWLGVFVTGSDTSSNAIFARLQYVTADKLGLPPVLTVAANASGGVAGKMVSPQSIAVATAATGLTGQEATLFRKTVGHSLVLVGVVMAITFLQAHALRFMVPDTIVAAASKPSVAHAPFQAVIFLGLGVGLGLAMALLARRGKPELEETVRQV